MTLTSNIMEINQFQVYTFNQKHDLTVDSQFKQLTEETGELAEALNTDSDTDEVAQELADVVFVARSIAEMYDINLSRWVNDTIAENLEKDATTDGDKVTKSGLTSADN